MCGIAGLATATGRRRDDGELVHRMLGTLLHRGPDDQHQLGDERAMLGATRLAIIDVEGGKQPMSDESGRILCSQNGEIYNYVELMEDLQRRGHVFRTHCDTETIVHLYEEYGLDFVQHLQGMFSIAIWDGPRNRLVLARDRLGKKTLYWRLADGRLTYGSEMKALLADASCEREVDRAALAHYLQYQYVPSPMAILQGVQKLPPASILVWEGGEPRIERYWAPDFRTRPARSLQEDVEEALGLLREAVRIRLRSDVPLGVFLSGGIDSSVVAALMTEQAGKPVTAFSIGFDDVAYDELPYARQIARHLHAEHVTEIVRIDALELLPVLAYHFDEPFADSSALPTYRVARLAGSMLKVVLTGDGGDEAFGGYDRYRAYQAFGRLSLLPAPVLRSLAGAGGALAGAVAPKARTTHRLRRVAAMAGLDGDHRYLAQMTIVGAATRSALNAGRRRRVGCVSARHPAAGPADPIGRLTRADLHSYLPEDVLTKVDRATMANALEARSPILDRPPGHRIRRGPAVRSEDGRRPIQGGPP